MNKKSALALFLGPEGIKLNYYITMPKRFKWPIRCLDDEVYFQRGPTPNMAFDLLFLHSIPLGSL